MDAPRAIAFVVGIVAIVATVFNSLSLQSGSHPPPLLNPAEAEEDYAARCEAGASGAPHALRTRGVN
jgi:hypothetical protein